jgi:Domain of unknown function (DUF5753)
MQEQLLALLEAARRPRVSLQVIPFSVGAHPGLDSRFVMLQVGDEQTPELIHVEGLTGVMAYDRPADFAHFVYAWNELSSIALPPTESLQMINRIANSHTLTDAEP